MVQPEGAGLSARLLPMARIALAGHLDHTLLAECPGVLLAFFDTPEACVLRLVCREFQAAVAAHPWEDRETVILGSIGAWRACFPRPRCANVRRYDPHMGTVRRMPVVDADFVHFVGLWELNMGYCWAVTDAAFVHLRGIRVLDMSYCSQPTITDAGLAHLVGIQKLCIRGCRQATLTDAAFAPLRGIRVLNMSGCPQFTDAAFAHLKGVHTLLMWSCDQPTITDAALAHLRGIKCLVLDESSIPFTELGLVHLRGITRLHMRDANAASIAAACDLDLPVTTGDVEEWSLSASAIMSQAHGLRALRGTKSWRLACIVNRFLCREFLAGLARGLGLHCQWPPRLRHRGSAQLRGFVAVSYQLTPTDWQPCEEAPGRRKLHLPLY